MVDIVVFNELSTKEKLDRFSQEMVERNGDHIRSYIAAGFSSHSAENNALKYLHKNAAYVSGYVKRNMVAKSIKYISELERLANGAESETVKLGALKYLIDSSGFNSVEDLEELSATDMSKEDRRVEIEQLKAKLKVI